MVNVSVEWSLVIPTLSLSSPDNAVKRRITASDHLRIGARERARTKLKQALRSALIGMLDIASSKH